MPKDMDFTKRIIPLFVIVMIVVGSRSLSACFGKAMFYVGCIETHVDERNSP